VRTEDDDFGTLETPGDYVLEVLDEQRVDDPGNNSDDYQPLWEKYTAPIYSIPCSDKGFVIQILCCIMYCLQWCQ
jgi:hypothetical protein